MWKLKRARKHMMNTFFFILLGFSLLTSILSVISIELYIFAGFIAIIGYSIVIRLTQKSPEKYINNRGYVVLSFQNELEHREIAKQKIGRDLTSSEIVHHINGKKTDNRIENLCLMDKEKHEFFHTWLRWKKEKSSKYPCISTQKKVLVNEYNGILLSSFDAQPTAKPTSIEHKPPQNEIHQRQLFDVLKKERKRIAEDNNIPVYMIFNNRTLREMSVLMPESEREMLKIHGIGHIKYKLYGLAFTVVIKKFKSDISVLSKNKKSPA